MRPPARNGRNGDGAGSGLRLAVETHGVTVLLRLTGDCDLSTVAGVEAAFDSARDASTRHVVFDLRAVTFLDIAGLRTLIKANELSHTEAFDVQIVPPAGLARRVFTLTRAGDRLTLVDHSRVATPA